MQSANRALNVNIRQLWLILVRLKRIHFVESVKRVSVYNIIILDSIRKGKLLFYITNNQFCENLSSPFLGYYWSRVYRKCRKCSYCYPDQPRYRRRRLNRCALQGLPLNFQCIPLFNGPLKNTPKCT